MEKITKVDSRKIINSLFIALIFFSSPSFAQKYADQVVIEMTNAAKTLYDIRVFSLIRNMYEKQTIIDPLAQDWINTSFESERDAYINQFLVQDYVAENDLRIRPAKTDLDPVFQKIQKLLQKDGAGRKMMNALDISDSEVKQWIENRMMFEKFLATSIQERIVVTEQKMLAYFESNKTKFPKKTFTEVESRIREELSNELINEEFQKWVEQEKRRKKIIIKALRS